METRRVTSAAVARGDVGHTIDSEFSAIASTGTPPSPHRQRLLPTPVASVSKLVKPKPPSVMMVPPEMGPPVTGTRSRKRRGCS